MTWRVGATAVRAHELGLRWSIEARTDDLETTVTADTGPDGRLRDLQSDGYVGTAGDIELDYAVEQHIRDVLALRAVLQGLNEIDQQRWGRVQKPCDRARWAA